MTHNELPNRPRPRMLLAATLGAVLVIGSPSLSLAHEGHDHGGAPVAPLPATPAVSKFVAASEDFEVVGVLASEGLTIYLDDALTNQPIDEAIVDIVTEGSAAIAGKAERESPGTYRLAIKSPVPSGVYSLTLSVEAGQRSDLLTAKLVVEKPSNKAAQVSLEDRFPWKGLAGGALVFGAVVAVVTVLKRQRKSRPGADK